jgi:hypothetical protein
VPVAIRLAAHLARDVPNPPGVRIEIKHPAWAVVVAETIRGGAVLSAVTTFRATEVGHGGEDESVAE